VCGCVGFFVLRAVAFNGAGCARFQTIERGNP
jgi:hypothetical protein